MQTHGGPEADAVIASRERRFAYEIRVDWGGDGGYGHPLSEMTRFVDDITVDRSLAGSAPEELLLIEGAAAAELQFTAGGEYQELSLAAVFSPYNGLSPLYRQDVVGAEVTYRIGVHTGLGIVWYPQFIGNLRTITPDRETGEVTFTALDRVELLRRPVSFPAWGISTYHAARDRTQAQLVNSSWVIDHCLRGCDTSLTPYRPTYRAEIDVPDDFPDGVHFWLTATGSHLPTIGWLARAAGQVFPPVDDQHPMYEASGPHHPAAVGPDGADGPAPRVLLAKPDLPAALGYWANDRDQITPFATHYLGFTLTVSDAVFAAPDSDVLAVNVGDQRIMRIRVDGGQIYTDQFRTADNRYARSVSLPIPPDSTHLRVSAIWDNSEPSGLSVYLKVGEVDTGGWSTIGEPWNYLGDDINKGSVNIHDRISIGDVFYAGSNTFGAGTDFDNAWRNATYAAVLDIGLQSLSYMPTRRADDAWDVITDLAAAEFGSVFWDEHGIFRFWNYQRLLDKQNTAVRTVTLDELTSLQVTNSLDSVRNIYSLQVGRRTTTEGITYQSREVDEFYVPARTERKFQLWIDDFVAPNPYRLTRYTTDEANTALPYWHDHAAHGYVVQWLRNNSWGEDDSRIGVDIDVFFNGLGEVVVRIWNGWEEPVRLSTNSGQPALHIDGDHLVDAKPQIVTITDRDSIDRYGGRNLKLDGDWYQDHYSAQAITRTLMPRTLRPIPATDAITVAGDPRIQLGDCIDIADPTGLGERARVQIYGIRREFSRDNGLADTYTVEMIRPSGDGVWDSPQYGRWDNTFTWSK